MTRADILRRAAPDAVVGVALVALGIVEALATRGLDDGERVTLVVVALATGLIVGACRQAPAEALAATWVLVGWQMLTSTSFLRSEAAFVVVLFATARWGRPLTVVAGGLSVPGAAIAAVVFVVRNDYLPVAGMVDSRRLYDTAVQFSDSWRVGGAVLCVGVLGVPWLAGLVLRLSERARDSRISQERAEEAAAQATRDSEQAREIARLREDQARLANDVHDVVGHSLAVILAQAESAQFRSDEDPEQLKATMQHIATSARASLQDVRQVLAAGQHSAPPTLDAARPLDTLIDGVRASGHEVVARELGTPQPMPPELDVVAYRVLQEMLTNAIKHGRRDEPVFVERLWPDGSWAGELRLEVRNTVADDAESAEGLGLAGMRRRLEAVGGRLDLARRHEPDGVTFTATAWVPVRTVSR